MIRFMPAATQRFTTSNVAIIVVAMPFTGVVPSPSTILSTVCVRHGTPTFWRIFSITWSAVSAAGVCGVTVWAAESASPPPMIARLEGVLRAMGDPFLSFSPML